MKQGKVYMNIILGLFLAAVVCYFGYYLYSANFDPIRTVAAMEYEAGQGTYTTGFVVRQEQLVKSPYEITALMVTEGDRIACGQSIATGYRSADAQSRQAQIDRLKDELAQLDYASVYSSDASEEAALQSHIEAELQAVARAVTRRDMNAASDRSAAIKGLVLRSTSTGQELETLSQRVAGIKGQLSRLESDAGMDTKAIASAGSGYFSGSVDGYEAILTPDNIMDMTVAQLEKLEPEEVEADAVGKLITSSTWYYLTTVEEHLVQDVRKGDTIPVQFVSAFYDELPMTVERLSEPQDGKCILVLSCDRYTQDVTLLRQQSADMVFESFTGLRVPKEAIRVTDDRRTGVYVLVAGAAEWKYVDLLHDNGESYVVVLDKSSTDNLWPGDEVIITAQELYDGKVLQG